MNKMTKPVSNFILNQDDQLADFADRVRFDASVSVDPGTDDELRRLEETILRLNSLRPQKALDQETAKRMQADYLIRRRRLNAQEQAEQARRHTWFGALFRSPVAMAVASLVVVAVLVILSPSIGATGTSISGTAGLQVQPIGLVLIVGFFLILAVWLGRRK
jgi:hypothetical protein